MPKVTPHQLDIETASVIDVYQRLEDNIFAMFIERLKTKGAYALTYDTALQWQLERLNELHLINNDTIKLIAQATNIVEPMLDKMIMGNGVQIIDQVDQSLSDWTNQQPPPKQNIVDTTLKGLLHQTKKDISNNVNETLVSRNYTSGTAQIYRNIVTDTVTKVITGVATPDQALAQTIYKWSDAGIKSGLTNKAGRRMGLEGYVRSIITSTAYNTFNQLSIDRAKEYGWHTFVMSTHEAAREACAPIQGRVVLNVPKSSANANERDYPSIYDHDYGEPGGTLGVNCRHTLTPFNPESNTNTLHPPKPEEAIANHAIMQQQRALERRVRLYKRKKMEADLLEDSKQSKYFDQKIKDNQAALRSIVKDNDFLYRDYAREKSYNVGVKTDAQKVRSTINQQQYEKHRAGTKAFENYVKGSKGPVSEMTLDKYEQQTLINQYGTSDFAVKQVFFEHSSPIGYYVDESGNRIPTNYGRISYSKSGAHITPRRPLQ